MDIACVCVYMCESLCVCVCANGIRRRRLCEGEGKVRKGQEDVIEGLFWKQGMLEAGRKGGRGIDVTEGAKF